MALASSRGIHTERDKAQCILDRPFAHSMGYFVIGDTWRLDTIFQRVCLPAAFLARGSARWHAAWLSGGAEGF